jgi:hypothetical protein
MTATGKIQKSKMREQAISELRLGDGGGHGAVEGSRQ